MGSRFLVTGAAGFLGSHLAERLLADGHETRVLVRPTNAPRWLAERGAEVVVGDVTDPEALAALVGGCEVVFHAASLVTELAVADSEYFRVNTEASERLARAAAAAGVRRFVFVSSTSVHPANSGKPLDETSPLEPADAYARSKVEAEHRLDTVCRETGMTLVVVRPSRIYGARDVSLGRVFRAIARRRFLLVGASAAEVDFVYVTDVVDALVAAASRGQGVYVVGGPERVSLEQFFAEIAGSLERRLPALRIPLGPAIAASWLIARVYGAVGREPPVAPKRLAFFKQSRVVDHSRARADLDYRPAIPIRQGVERAARWYREAGWL